MHFICNSVLRMSACHRFDAAKGLSELSTLPWGDAALAQSFEAARELFNAAMPRFNKALQHYQLDGWVTEHVNIQFEVSNLYRWGPRSTGTICVLRVWCEAEGKSMHAGTRPLGARGSARALHRRNISYSVAAYLAESLAANHRQLCLSDACSLHHHHLHQQALPSYRALTHLHSLQWWLAPGALLGLRRTPTARASCTSAAQRACCRWRVH